jgi:hypothetical protein
MKELRCSTVRDAVAFAKAQKLLKISLLAALKMLLFEAH